MKAKLLVHDKVTDESGNTIEIKAWQIPLSKDKLHGFKYSLVYIVNGKRIIGYDNAEGKGDHRHIKEYTQTYKFVSLKKLTGDFFNDVEKFKEGIL